MGRVEGWREGGVLVGGGVVVWWWPWAGGEGEQ